MAKKNLWYRRLWYIKNRKTKRLRTYTLLISILIILGFVISYAEKKIVPSLVEISEYRVKAIVTASVNNAIKDIFHDDINYQELTTVNKDEKGRVTSIQTNVPRMNRMSASIGEYIQNDLSSIEAMDIKIPFGILMGKSILSGVGPDLYVKVIPVGNVQTSFETEISNTGTNQAVHRIIIKVKTSISIVAPLLNKKTELVTGIPVTEMVVVGDISRILASID